MCASNCARANAAELTTVAAQHGEVVENVAERATLSTTASAPSWCALKAMSVAELNMMMTEPELTVRPIVRHARSSALEQWSRRSWGPSRPCRMISSHQAVHGVDPLQGAALLQAGVAYLYRF